MKKLLSLLLIAILTLSLVLPVSAATPSGTVGENINWEVKNGTLYLTGTGAIPNYDPTQGRAPWYLFMSEITRIEVGEGITAIGEYAFGEMSTVEEISLPNSLVNVEFAAFLGCSGLSEITLPSGVKKVIPEAFFGCMNLENIHVAAPGKYYTSQNGMLYNTQKNFLLRCPEGKRGSLEIPWGTMMISQNAFDGCGYLKSVSFPGTVATIGAYAFLDCWSLEKVYLPDSVSSVFEGAFANCTSLTWARLSPQLSAIDKHTFANCRKLTEVVIPEGITFVNDYAFKNCSALTTMTIPQGVTMLSNNVFNGCSSLTTVNLPDSITTIANTTFYNCPNVKDINFAGTQAQWQSATCAQTSIPVSATIHYAKGTVTPVELPFTDVKKTDSRYDAICWAYEKKITDGISPTLFGPDTTCTRGHVVTFLWRMMNCPDPKSPTGVFRDVNSKDYFYLPVAWAVENEITDGMTPQTFEPDRTCSNAHILTFLWRTMGCPKAVTSGREWYSEAMAWAESFGICDRNLDPNADCPRATVLQFMYNTLK